MLLLKFFGLTLLCFSFFSLVGAVDYDTCYSNSYNTATAQICFSALNNEVFVDCPQGDRLYIYCSSDDCDLDGCPCSQVSFPYSSVVYPSEEIFSAVCWDQDSEWASRVGGVVTSTYDWWASQGITYGLSYLKDCDFGDEKCEGFDYYTCDSDYLWDYQGVVNGECGFSTPKDEPSLPVIYTDWKEETSSFWDLILDFIKSIFGGTASLTSSSSYGGGER
jgi:hypothetical protein